MGTEEGAPATRTLDVREIDRPFDDIMDALVRLGPDERLELINDFEPEPLYTVLDRRGYAHEATRVERDEWHVLIEPE